jgi:mannose-6-phosphate isomerase-like protein (cupin superfamily)
MTIYSEIRPWGKFYNILDESKYKVKKIIVKPGKRLSLQSHNYRNEHWIIVQGKAKVTKDKNEICLTENQHIFIPKKGLHRIENIGNIDLVFIEVQYGEYLGEDDIVRYSDDFGRI